MRKASKIGLVLAVASVVLASLPAQATIAGGGEVVGNVTITNPGCIPVATAAKKPVTYTFSDVVLTGSFTDTSKVFAGPIDVANVKGASLPAGDNTIEGHGTVNSALDRATFTGTSLNGTKIAGNFYGTYDRAGSIVLVDLNVSASIDGAAPQATKIHVSAQFSPSQGDGFSSPVCAASFAGPFHSMA